MAEKFGLCSALGIPLPGNNETAGILCLYSKKSMEVDPLLTTLIQKAMMMLSASELDTSVLEYIDVDNLAGNAIPSVTVIPSSQQSYSCVSKTAPDFVFKVNLMGSLARSSIKNNSESEAGLSSSQYCKVTNTDPRNDAPKQKLYDSSGGYSSYESLMSLESGTGHQALAGSQNGIIKSKGESSSALRKCTHEGCVKLSQGTTLYCIAHGGGRRCTFPNCNKGARGKLYCSKHGGGKRCIANNCTKSAVGGSNYCTTHGGGRRCLFDGCTKSAQSSTTFCVKHGGGRLCQVENCCKCARGKTDFCASHGAQLMKGVTNLKRKASDTVVDGSTPSSPNEAMKRQK